MKPIGKFENQPKEFWAVVKLVSLSLKYAERGTGNLKCYSVDEVRAALRNHGLNPDGHDETIELVSEYSRARAQIMNDEVRHNLLEGPQARDLFEELRKRIDPPTELLPMNKQKGEKRHFAYLTCIVNMLTYEGLRETQGAALFDSDPRGPLTFASNGMPLRTLFRRMDGAYPNLNHPWAAWEIKEYYDSKTFGSRIADGVYESALDGYELNELREEGIEVEHYLFADAYHTWWTQGKGYLCRIIDMMHSGLLDEVFFGKEVIDGWPPVVSGWPSTMELIGS